MSQAIEYVTFVCHCVDCLIYNVVNTFSFEYKATLKERERQRKKHHQRQFDMATVKRLNVRINRKLVIVGDGMCGKTCLLYAFKDDRFIPNHDATIFDTYVADIQIDGITVRRSETNE